MFFQCIKDFGNYCVRHLDSFAWPDLDKGLDYLCTRKTLVGYADFFKSSFLTSGIFVFQLSQNL